MGVASINGISVRFDDVGDGADVLVFVHGHPFDRSMWRPQLAALAGSGWRVVAADLRGYGESSVVPGTTTLDVFARDIAGLLDHLGVASVVLCGLSMGGQIVMEFCRLFPGRVRGIALAATFARPETASGKQDRRAMADRLLREGMEGYANEVVSKMVAPRNIVALPTVAAHVHSMMLAAHPEGAAAALRGRAERPAYDETLAAMEVPALIVVGDEDSYTTRADAEHMHALLRHSQLAWIVGCGHMPNLEREAEFNAALKRLLDVVQAVSATALDPS